jgi:hypothetical protein
MSSMTRFDTEKLRTRRIIATAMLTVFTIAVLLLSETSAAVSATPHGARASYPAAMAEDIPAGQAPGEVAAQYHDADESAGENKVQTASSARPVRPQEQ